MSATWRSINAETNSMIIHMNNESSASGGQLYVVSTPIGNLDDITVRAIAVLQSADVIVCEEQKEARGLLDYYDIDKELLELNEHNDTEATIAAVKLLAAGKKLALISDAGTPVLADPGGLLVAAAIRYGYPVHVVPGPSSILAALVRSGMPTDQFLYAGFLSRKKDERARQVRLLALEPRTIVLLDSPYRLATVLGALAEVMPQRRAYIGCNLTMPNETHHYGTLAELSEYFAAHRFRGEYAIVIEGNPSANQWYALLEQNVAGTNHRSSRDETVPDEQQPAEVQSAESSSESFREHAQYPEQPNAPTPQRTQHKPNTSSQPHRYERHRSRRPHRSHGRHHYRESDADRNRYDYEQPIVNYTLSNPYQQHKPSPQPPHPHQRPQRRSRGPRKRWRR